MNLRVGDKYRRLSLSTDKRVIDLSRHVDGHIEFDMLLQSYNVSLNNYVCRHCCSDDVVPSYNWKKGREAVIQRTIVFSLRLSLVTDTVVLQPTGTSQISNVFGKQRDTIIAQTD